jgi:two-component system, cell cycle sensor histidine kinase and response regulator CckA
MTTVSADNVVLIEEKSDKISVNNLSVLLVEDQDDLREAVSQFLTAKGCVVFEAINGEDALAVAKQNNMKFDMVISDVVMPKMGGRELVKELKAIKPDLKVLLMSGFSGQQTETEFKILEKPFVASDLIQRIRQLI